MKTTFKVMFFCAFTLFTGCQQKNSERAHVLDIIKTVNGYWQENNSAQVNSFWDNAVYHTGNMEAYSITKEEAYRKYSEDWAEFNKWEGARSDNKKEWLYSYGEDDKYVLFGDQQVCFQVYCDLYNLAPEDKKIARALEVMEYQINTNNVDYWWWCDALFMTMPVMPKLYLITKDQKFLDKMYQYISYTDSILYDNDTGLYYRDSKYVWPRHKSVNGKKDFWARGDGWVFAGLAKVLKDLPKTDIHKNFYIFKFKKMAVSIAKCQQPDGYWTRSMLDAKHAPGQETSGTAFFAYGLMWGVDNGYLSREYYRPVIEKAWKYLSKVALQNNGKIGYIQPIGERAIPGQIVDKNSTANFGVGAFLLAACERVRYLELTKSNGLGLQ